MKRKILFSFILFIILYTNVNAEENKLYFKESDNKIYYNSSQLDKESFMYHVDMVPGSTYTDELVIENGTKRTYTLFFKVKQKQLSEESEDLLNNINMKIYLDEELIYDGKANGLNYNDEGIDLQNAIELKSFNSSDKSIMKVETKLSNDYSNKNLDEASYIDWVFYAQYDIPNNDKDVKPGIEPEKKPQEIEGVPDTHKSNLPVSIVSAFTCLIGLGIVIYAKKKED